MTCKEIHKYFSDYADSEISESLKKEIEEHINICPSCRVLFNKANNIIKCLNGITRIKTSENFDDRLRERIAQEFNLKNSFFSNWSESLSFVRSKPAIGFAVAAVFIAAIVVMFNNQSSLDRKFEFGKDSSKKDVINQNKAGIVSDKSNLLKNNKALTVSSSGNSDSTVSIDNLNEEKKLLKGKVKYINK